MASRELQMRSLLTSQRQICFKRHAASTGRLRLRTRRAARPLRTPTAVGREQTAIFIAYRHFPGLYTSHLLHRPLRQALTSRRYRVQ